MKKKLVTAAFAMTLLLTGCGSSDDDKNVSKNTGKETFTIGMECNYAPFNWQTKEQTKTSVSIGGAGFCDGYDHMSAAHGYGTSSGAQRQFNN